LRRAEIHRLEWPEVLDEGKIASHILVLHSNQMVNRSVKTRSATARRRAAARLNDYLRASRTHLTMAPRIRPMTRV
jgi:hypothetical protein